MRWLLFFRHLKVAKTPIRHLHMYLIKGYFTCRTVFVKVWMQRGSSLQTRMCNRKSVPDSRPHCTPEWLVCLSLPADATRCLHGYIRCLSHGEMWCVCTVLLEKRLFSNDSVFILEGNSFPELDSVFTYTVLCKQKTRLISLLLATEVHKPHQSLKRF